MKEMFILGNKREIYTKLKIKTLVKTIKSKDVKELGIRISLKKEIRWLVGLELFHIWCLEQFSFN